MKKTCSVYKILMLLMSVSLLMHSCVRPDLSDCPPQNNVRIVVKTYAEAEGLDDKYDMQNVVIYVFDQQYKFVEMWEGPAYTYDKDYVAIMNLAPGNYHFAVWTNHSDPYVINKTKEQCYSEKPSLDDLFLSLQIPHDKKVKSDVPDLLYGNKFDATIQSNNNYEHTVILTPNTYTVNFTVRGLPVNNHTYEFKAEDNNSHYSFKDNSIMSGLNSFEYYRTSQFSGNEIKSTIKGLKLDNSRDPQFSFSNLTQSKVLYSNDIVAMITKAYAAGPQPVNFDRTFVFDIVITFGNLGVEVSVNGWSYKENGGNLE